MDAVFIVWFKLEIVNDIDLYTRGPCFDFIDSIMIYYIKFCSIKLHGMGCSTCALSCRSLFQWFIAAFELLRAKINRFHSINFFLSFKVFNNFITCRPHLMWCKFAGKDTIEKNEVHYTCISFIYVIFSVPHSWCILIGKHIFLLSHKSLGMLWCKYDVNLMKTLCGSSVLHTFWQ